MVRPLIRCEFQMQCGSIGWSVGATLGYAQAAKSKRVIACIGDGSFQVTAQDVSKMIRCGQKTIIFLINNDKYFIKVEIHDGPYTVIKNWNYSALADAIHNDEGKCWIAKMKYEEELKEAICTATESKKDCLCFIEVIVHKNDTSNSCSSGGRGCLRPTAGFPIPSDLLQFLSAVSVISRFPLLFHVMCRILRPL